MSNDYLRYIAQELKDAGVDKITPAQLDDLAYHLDVSQVERQLEAIAESENYEEETDREE